MPFTWGCLDDVARRDGDGDAVGGLNQPGAGDDIEQLAPGMGGPVGPGARGELHGEQLDAVLGVADSRVPDAAGEMIRRRRVPGGGLAPVVFPEGGGSWATRHL